MQRYNHLHHLVTASRQEQAADRQLPQRQREQNARRRATEFSNHWGRSTSQAARGLSIRRRTLAHWRSRERDGEWTCRLRGRPCKESSYEKRHTVLEVIEDVGPHVGLPSLRGLFKNMPRCELSDLQRDYRRHYREQNRVLVDQLTWTTPGHVWAMDHAKPPLALEDPYQAIFAVRDLGSGMQLAWLPVADQTAETMLPVLKALFLLHGVPLVIKSDNGSAFIAELTHRLLADQQVVHLLSPPMTPSYNGSCEAGIGSMKTRTSHHAARSGRAEQWTPDDLEAARRQANEVHRSTHGAPTAAKRWTESKLATTIERQTLRDAIDRHRNEHIASLRRKNVCTTEIHEHTIERIAIRRALVELGILTLNRRSITLPIKPNNLEKFS